MMVTTIAVISLTRINVNLDVQISSLRATIRTVSTKNGVAMAHQIVETLPTR